MIDLNVRPVPGEDGITHVNTHSKASTDLGKVLAPSFDMGEPIHHPLLGTFRTLENLWYYLNTGGTRDQLRRMEPHVARNFVRLTKKYKCNKFYELTVDATILKLQTHTSWTEAMTNEHRPFDHYFLKGPDRMTIRPGYTELFLKALDEVQQIFRGEKEHEFVRFKDLKFEELPEKKSKK